MARAESAAESQRLPLARFLGDLIAAGLAEGRTEHPLAPLFRAAEIAKRAGADSHGWKWNRAELYEDA